MCTKVVECSELIGFTHSHSFNKKNKLSDGKKQDYPNHSSVHLNLLSF